MLGMISYERGIEKNVGFESPATWDVPLAQVVGTVTTGTWAKTRSTLPELQKPWITVIMSWGDLDRQTRQSRGSAHRVSDAEQLLCNSQPVSLPAFPLSFLPVL